MKVTAFRYCSNGGHGYFLIRFRRKPRARGEFTAIVFEDETGLSDTIMAAFGPGGLSEPVSPDEWINDIRRVLARHELALCGSTKVNDIREFGYADWWASKRVLDLINKSAAGESS